MGMPQLEIVAVALIVLAGCIMVREHRMRRSLLAVSMLYGFFHFYSQWHSLYHLYPLMLFMFMSIASWVNCIRTRAQLLIRLVMLVVLVQLCLVALYRSATTIIASPPHHITVVQFKNRLVHDLSGRLAPGETVQVMEVLVRWNYMHCTLCVINSRHDLFMMHIFFIILIIRTQKKSEQSFCVIFKAGLRHIFVVSRFSLPWLGYERIETFPELRDWLHKNYVMETDAGFYHLYRRK